ncbi:unnamed protein product [Malus baccata var. baccata]
MLSLAKRLKNSPSCFQASAAAATQLRWARTESGPSRRRHKSPAMAMRKQEQKSKWWIVDGEIHEIGDHVPPRERFVIPRDNIPNKRRKQLRDQFMRRTRLVLKETEHEPWCKKYMELYQELEENWERLYWDEGFSKKIAQDHANYESAEDDAHDFSPYRSKRFHPKPYKESAPISYIEERRRRHPPHVNALIPTRVRNKNKITNKCNRFEPVKPSIKLAGSSSGSKIPTAHSTAPTRKHCFPNAILTKPLGLKKR